MDPLAIYHFIFETYAGLGILMSGCLVICAILAFTLELRTRKRYRDRGPRKPGEGFFDLGDDDESDEGGDGSAQ